MSVCFFPSRHSHGPMRADPGHHITKEPAITKAYTSRPSLPFLPLPVSLPFPTYQHISFKSKTCRSSKHLAAGPDPPNK
jgi:hypothetical protein